MKWEDKWAGKMWVAQQSTQSDGRVFERVMRAPGSRIILVKQDRMLLSREKRTELGGKIDYRLPGGKVFDTNDLYQEYLKTKTDIVEASRESIVKEALEEVGVIIEKNSLQYLGVDILGATCTWDLHYWAAKEFTLHSLGARYHETESEEIVGSEWIAVNDVKKLVLDSNQFSESRSAIAILRYLENNI